MYKHLDPSQYTVLRKKLVRKKGSEFQQAFIEASLSNKKFVDFVREQVNTKEGDDIPELEEQLTENQYKYPPYDTEDMIYRTWKMIPPKETCSVSFWGEVTLRHIENGCVDAYFLASDSGSLPSGRGRVDKCLSLNGTSKDIDSCVRTILRRMSGLPEARGNRTPYVDCPFGRAWWRTHLLEEIVKATNLPSSKFRVVLRLSQTYWEKLITLMVSRNSILGSVKVRHALIWVLSDILEVDPNSKILQASALDRLCRLLGLRCAWQELGVLEIYEIKQLIEKEILPQSG